MSYEYYFSKKNIHSNTWCEFIEQEYKGILDSHYSDFEKIVGYGWKDKFGFNHDGRALYISELQKVYNGIWFEIGDRKIGIFK